MEAFLSCSFEAAVSYELVELLHLRQREGFGDCLWLFLGEQVDVKEVFTAFSLNSFFYLTVDIMAIKKEFTNTMNPYIGLMWYYLLLDGALPLLPSLLQLCSFQS